jgi:hypothetical protein
VRRVANGREVVTLPDTTRGQVAALAGAFGDLHPYVVPVLRALPVAAARAPYAAWVPNELAHATGAPESDEPKPAYDHVAGQNARCAARIARRHQPAVR